MTGKGKAKTNIDSAADDERVGGKRKRMDERERAFGELDDSGITKSDEGAHKRKRRRKGTSMIIPEVIDS
jgi:hypothetical protein